jgi:GTP-binding protein
MRFIDEAKIKIAGGHGGPGCVSFRRETMEPRGGPNGGDGGEGGDVVFIASRQLGTLQDFRFKREYSAPAGDNGSGSNKAGRDGENIEIRVPVGTIIKDAETGEQLIDFLEDGQVWVACKGGRGGKGNAHFVSSTFQAPKFAQPGEEGERRELTLELKLLADVGIIGFPNAGKSTLISRISAAKPKIADYPFTTLIPNLGVVSLSDFRSFVVADIPGLVEGAHRGEGLGHKFLRHIERTRVFVHLLDGVKLLEADSEDPESVSKAEDSLVASYEAIRRELGLFSETLLHKPEIVAINKADTLDPAVAARAAKRIRELLNSVRGTPPLRGEPFVVSAVSSTGLGELLEAVSSVIDQSRPRDANPVRMPDDEDIRT